MHAPETVLTEIQRIVEPVLMDMGYELVDSSFTKQGRDWYLRLFIDKEGGVSLDDCVAVSREIGVVLDAEDPVPGAYHLEVSSPGLDRPLTKEQDFSRFQGQSVRVKMRMGQDPDGQGYNRKTFVGNLQGLTDGNIRLRLHETGNMVELPWQESVSVRLEPQFD